MDNFLKVILMDIKILLAKFLFPQHFMPHRTALVLFMTVPGTTFSMSFSLQSTRTLWVIMSLSFKIFHRGLLFRPSFSKNFPKSFRELRYFWGEMDTCGKFEANVASSALQLILQNTVIPHSGSSKLGTHCLSNAVPVHRSTDFYVCFSVENSP